MPQYDVKNLRMYFLVVLALLTLFIWYAVAREPINGQLTVSFLNIGQGDAIFIEAPNGNQMMIDGGPGKAVVRELGRAMPFYDRTIDVLLVTNPDKDHLAGFIDVLDAFKVETVIEPGTVPDTAVYREFKRLVENEKSQTITARKGERIVLDAETFFEIYFPDRDASGLDTNTGSIVGKLVHKNSCILFPGDAPDEIEKFLVERGDDLSCEVLKVGHHGSRTSTSELFLEAVAPRLAIISAGANNSYGHPHAEVTLRLEKHQVEILGTYELGRITLVSNGTHFTHVK